MEVFCLEPRTGTARGEARLLPRVLPLPTVLDSRTVVLLHLLLQEEPTREVVMDASGLRELCPVAALLLASALRARAGRAAGVRIERLSWELRRRLDQHPLQRFLAPGTPGAVEPAVA